MELQPGQSGIGQMLILTFDHHPPEPDPTPPCRGPTCDPLRGPRALGPAPLGAMYCPPGAAAVAATTAHDPRIMTRMPRIRPTRSARSTGRRILHLKPRTVARAPGPVAEGAGRVQGRSSNRARARRGGLARGGAGLGRLGEREVS